MTVADIGSTVPRRQLGRFLRQLREDARITVKAAADALEWSPPKIWRIENGAVAMRSLDVEAMCRAYGAPAEVSDALMALARETRSKGWWHSYSDAIPQWFELYVGLEAAASRLRFYAAELIPGLLQTKAYMAEVFRIAWPGMTDAEVDRGVAVRSARQALLTRRLPPPPTLEVILSESVMRRGLSDGEAMAGQLGHLADLAVWPGISIRVIPVAAGLHRASMANGSFTILSFPAESEPTTVYSDGLTGALYLDKPAEISAFEEVWAAIEAVSLNEGDSLRLIQRAVKELT